jgi:hypothetical protein
LSALARLISQAAKRTLTTRITSAQNASAEEGNRSGEHFERQFWFGAVDSVVQQDRHARNPADYMGLFNPEAPWAKAASRLNVFMISTQFATRATDAELATVVGDLRRRKIALALEAGMLRNDKGCGKGEGYMPQNLLKRAVTRIRRAGGDLNYVSMDEVVFFGHERNWPDKNGPACQDSIEEIAREVSDKVAEIRAVFPDAQIGAVEPITTGHGFDSSQLVKDYADFADRYQAQTGMRLAFLHADIAWRSPGWESAVRQMKAAASVRGIRFGVVFGGTPDQKDNVSWTGGGLAQLRAFVGNSTMAPDDVLIQTWQPLPTRELPETTPGTHTWMLLQAESSVR